MQAEAQIISAQVTGFRDLDNMSVAKRFFDKIKSDNFGDYLKLDFRGCYLDYNSCSYIIESILNSFKDISESRKIEIYTGIDIGKAENYQMLFFRSASSIIDGETDPNEIAKKIEHYCVSKSVEISIKVMEYGQELNDTPKKEYLLSVLSK